LFVPGNQRHGDGENGHLLASQQVIGDGVLFGNEPIVQADNHRQAEHENKRYNLCLPV